MTDQNDKKPTQPSDEGIASLLNNSIQISAWSDFKKNYNADNYLFLEPDVDLVDTCLKIIKDRKDEIETLVNEAKIKKVPLESLISLGAQAQVKFLIVQPYTVFQLFSGA